MGWVGFWVKDRFTLSSTRSGLRRFGVVEGGWLGRSGGNDQCRKRDLSSSM